MTYVSESFWHDAVNKATTDLFTFGYKHIIKPVSYTHLTLPTT